MRCPWALRRSGQGLLGVGRHPTLARSRCSADFHRDWATRGAAMAKFKQIELQDAYDDAPRPVAAMAKSFADGAHTTVHRHGRGQLLHAVSGVMRIETADAAWLVP